MTPEELGKLVENAAAALGEQFDTVQILTSNSDGDGTRCIKRGVGNFYARLGMAKEMLDEDQAQVWAKVFDERLKDE